MKFSMVTNDAVQNNSNSQNDNTPDWDAINAEKQVRQDAVIALLETQDESISVSGVVSGYIDLGIQERGEYEDEYKPTDPDHIKKLESGSFVEERYNGKLKRKVPTICTPAKPAKAFALVVDFPTYMQDFGGEIGEKPFRMFMGGTFFVKNPDSTEGKKMQIIQNPFYMVENTNNPQNKWALGVTSLPARMCVAAGLADADGLVNKDSIVGLLGKALQFEVRVWNKPDKNDPSKTYYTENIKFVGKLPKGMAIPTLDDSALFGVNMTAANNPDMVKQVRAVAKNTMKLATNFEGSILQQEFAAAASSRGSSNNTATKPPVTSATETKPQGSVSVPDKTVSASGNTQVDLDEGWDDDQQSV